MATYTTVTTATEESALAKSLATANAAIDAQNATIAAQNAVLAKQTPPGTPVPLLTHLDKPTHFNNNAHGFLANMANANQVGIAADAITAFMSASAANQGQVLTLLGMSAYASLPQPQLLEALQVIGLPAFLQLTPDKQNQAFALVGLTA